MVGRNVRMDIRWTAADADQARGSAAELVALAPDVILASSGSVVGPLRRLTRTIPIVFTETSDPVGAGFVESLSRPADPLTEVSRNGARALLAQAVEAEVAALLSGHADEMTEDGRQRLVRQRISTRCA
jgi:ABC-type uncharacterized transport system substrate-binding protein